MEYTLGAAIGYSSGKNNSSLKTPPTQKAKQEKFISSKLIKMPARKETHIVEEQKLENSSYKLEHFRSQNIFRYMLYQFLNRD